MGTETTSSSPRVAIMRTGQVGSSLARSSHREEGDSKLLEGEREAAEIPGSTLRLTAVERGFNPARPRCRLQPRFLAETGRPCRFDRADSVAGTLAEHRATVFPDAVP